MILVILAYSWIGDEVGDSCFGENSRVADPREFEDLLDLMVAALRIISFVIRTVYVVLAWRKEMPVAVPSVLC